MPELSPPASGLVRFGVFELNLRSGEMRRAGVRIGLQEQPFQVLALLLERPGDLFTREQLRERLWPDGTSVDFEHGLNAVVNRLRDTLGDSAESPRFIETLPRRGYRFIAPVLGDPADAGRVRSDAGLRSAGWLGAGLRQRRRRARPAATAAVSLLVLIAIAAWLFRSKEVWIAPPRVVPLTTLNGEEYGPTFSPDGEQVAFVWSGEKSDNLDIYVKIVGASQMRRLTSNPEQDLAPSWSPDGRQIAFVRAGENGARVHVISPLGGPDLEISDLPVSGRVSWSADGRYIAVAGAQHELGGGRGIYLVPLNGGEPRDITQPTVRGWDGNPAFSPDGRTLAYVACAATWPCNVQVVELDAGLTPAGPPRRLTPGFSFGITALAWTRDGHAVVYDSEGPAFLTYLWRVDVDGHRPPERIEVAGLGATRPSIAPARDRLAFSRLEYDVGIYRLERGRSAVRLVASSVADFQPQFSPDGRRFAFCSSRSGDAVEIWLAAADGSGAQQLTHGPGRWQCSAQWSPDGRRIAFDSWADDGHFHIWSIDATGGSLRQLTKDAGDQIAPTWSRDGRWIYFSWDNAGGRDIWRMGANGGPHERVTRGGSGRFGCESPDGKSFLYQRDDRELPLVSVPLGGGRARQIVNCVSPTAFSAGSRDIYYVGCHAGADPLVHALNPTTGDDRPLNTLNAAEGDVPFLGLAVAPDGNSILYTRHVGQRADLMMIENFR